MERARRSGKIQKKLLNHPRFFSTRSLLLYVALSSEVETRPILEEAWKRGKKVYLPRMDPSKKKMWAIETKDLEKLRAGAYGILEPAFELHCVGKPNDLELVIVPGLGFDREGGRLGRGEGYFDRFLEEAKASYKIGLAFECQMVERVPREANDMILDEILVG
jgi:5-formyltetrahydrofolate cyclo-ligase